MLTMARQVEEALDKGVARAHDRPPYRRGGQGVSWAAGDLVAASQVEEVCPAARAMSSPAPPREPTEGAQKPMASSPDPGVGADQCTR